jgi:hypothetical protein
MYVAGMDCSWFLTLVELTYDEAGSPYRQPLTVDLANQDYPSARAIERVLTSESGEARRAA